MAMDDDKTRISPEATATGTGTQLSGIYELDERIASGGMGEVYRGHNIQTGDKVAIKIVLPEFARDPTILGLFRKEASILNHLSHDAIVRYHVFTVDPGIQRPYLAMEFVDGDALYDIIRRGPLATEDVRRLSYRLALGLTAVHDAGAVHRDLSPDNIILPGGRVDRAKIIDFGIARSSHVGGETLIGGKFAGKYNYVSPEQLGLNGGEVSDKSDIYSLGLVIAAALLGKPLEMSGSQLDIVEKRRTVPNLSDIDPTFRHVIEAMLQPDPRDRPTSSELAEMTSPAAFGVETSPPSRTVAGGFTPGERPPSFVAHRRPDLAGSRPPTAAPARTAPGSKTPGTGGGSRNIVIGGAVAVLVAAAVGAYFTGIISFKDPEAASTSGPATSLTPAKETAPEDVAQDDRAIAPAPAETSEPEETEEAFLPSADSTPPASETAKPEPAPEPEPTPAPAASPPPDAAPATAETAPADTAPADTSPSDTAPAETPPATADAAPADTAAADTTPPPPAEPAPAETTPAEAATPPAVTAPADAAPTETAPAEIAPADSALAEETAAAMPVPEPVVPPPPTVDPAKVVDWVGTYDAGACSYAAASATPESITVSGIGSSTAAFDQMAGAIQAEFGLQPQLDIQAIEASQCAVPAFLRTSAGNGTVPLLAMSQTSIPDGTPVAGTITTAGDGNASVFLVDHKGMVFNLTERFDLRKPNVDFSIPIGLGAADKAAGRALPQMIVVISGTRGIDAANFTRPVSAEQLFPAISEELKAQGRSATAAAQVFALGG
jgi:serine/threonine protein kinase